MLKFHENEGRFTARAGILYLLIVPAYGDTCDEDVYNWFLCRDFEDKCEEYAIAQGNEKNFTEARYSVMLACNKVAQDILEVFS